MEAILSFEQSRLRKLVIIASLGLLLSLCLFNITLAYDFSGGYTSSRTVGTTGGNIITIGGSSSSALDVGMEREEIPVQAATTESTIARDFLIAVLPIIIAGAVIISIFRVAPSTALPLTVVLGLVTYAITWAILSAIL